MRMILNEYGLAVVYVIVVVTFMSVILVAVNDPDHGFITVYNSNMVYANDLMANTDAMNTTLDEYTANGKFDSIDEVSNIVAGARKPTFTVDASITNDDYIIEVPATGSADRSYYTYDQALDLFSANGKIHLQSWNGSTYVDLGLTDDVDIVITKMTPVIRGVDGTLETVEVPSRDKYGSIMRHPDGTPIMVTQVLYNEHVYNRSGDTDNSEPIEGKHITGSGDAEGFYIDWDEACRYRVLFRYTNGTLKSEYSAMFVNKIRSAEEIYEEVYTEWVEP